MAKHFSTQQYSKHYKQSNSHPLELGDAEEDLHDGAQVAAVAQVLDARVTRAVHRLQLGGRLLDHLPLADPRPRQAVVVVCVVAVLRLPGVTRTEADVVQMWFPNMLRLLFRLQARRTGKIVVNPSHHGHELFESLPSGRRLWSIRTKTSRHKNSFFPTATGLINKTRDPPPDPHPLWTLTLNLILTFIY